MVADDFPLHGGAQLTIDTKMVSPLHSNGVARRGASSRKGLALEVARKRKEIIELAGGVGMARLVVFATKSAGDGFLMLSSCFPWHGPKFETYQSKCRCLLKYCCM